jgi:hypothetical protein
MGQTSQPLSASASRSQLFLDRAQHAQQHLNRKGKGRELMPLFINHCEPKVRQDDGRAPHLAQRYFAAKRHRRT